MPRNILDTPPSLTERLAAAFFLGDILVSVDNPWLEPGALRRQPQSKSHGSSGQRQSMVLNQRRGLRAPRGSVWWGKRESKRKKRKRAGVKKRNIKVVLKFFEID